MNVTTPDVAASNGIIHVLDGVLLPSIVDTAVGYDDGKGAKFSTLVTAVTAADLGPTLSGPGTFTVFAPTDATFDKLKTDLGATAFNAGDDCVREGRCDQYGYAGIGSVIEPT